MHKIPVFVSCPTTLSVEQNQKREVIIKIMEDLQLEPRALGRSDYPKDYPLKEVYIIAKHCSGGIILGFEQLQVQRGIRKRNTESESPVNDQNIISIPTPWNHLEAGILYGLKIPLLIFKETGVEGGVFDHGITDAFVHSMPSATPDNNKISEIKNVMLKWYAFVSSEYTKY